MPTIVVSGAGSGIGRAFVESFASDPETYIYALDKFFSSPSTYPNVSQHVVDVTSPPSIASLSAALTSTTSGTVLPVDLFVHSAGIRGLVPSVEYGHLRDISSADTLAVMDLSTLMWTFEVNTAGTFMLIQALLPHLKAAAAVTPSVQNSATVASELSSSQFPSAPKVIIMGSRMGSVGYNTTGGAYAYRASKAALNAIIKSLSIDVPDVAFAVVHPGRVESNLVKIREQGAIEAEESVREMMKLIGKLGKENSGGFFDRFGEVIEW